MVDYHFRKQMNLAEWKVARTMAKLMTAEKNAARGQTYSKHGYGCSCGDLML